MTTRTAAAANPNAVRRGNPPVVAPIPFVGAIPLWLPQFRAGTACDELSRVGARPYDALTTESRPLSGRKPPSEIPLAT